MKKIVGEGQKFERIRRITGYLVGDTDRFNNGKRAEEADLFEQHHGSSARTRLCRRLVDTVFTGHPAHAFFSEQEFHLVGDRDSSGGAGA